MLHQVSPRVAVPKENSQDALNHLVIWLVASDSRLTIEPLASANWRVSEVDSIEATALACANHAMDALLFPAEAHDPYNARSLEMLTSVFAHERPFVLTYAKYNPTWMGNFMRLSGSDYHFYCVPQITEVIAVVEAVMKTGHVRRQSFSES